MKIRHLLTALAPVFALGLLVSSLAAAQDAGQDEVTLKNGGSVRGTIVSSEPGASVKIIEVGQTQARVIPWSQVSDVEKGKYAPRGAVVQPGSAGPGYGSVPPPPPQAPGPPEPRLGDPGVVRLHIESPQRATIIEHRQALVGTIGNYALVLHGERNICTSPCDTVIDGNQGGVFRLADDDYPSGGPFALNTLSGDVTMRVQPGSSGMHKGGAALIGLGVPALVAGAILLPLGLTATVTDNNTGKSVGIPNKGLENAGIGLLVGGAVVLAGGIVLRVMGATHYTLTPTQAKSAAITPRYWMGEF